MAELGCLASIPSFSRTMPLAWEQPAKGFFHSEPRFALLKSLSAQRCSRRRLRSLRPAPRPRVLLLNHKGRTGGKRKVSDRSVAGRCGRVDPTLGGSGYFLENTRTLKRKSRANGRRGDAAAGASTRERRSSMAGRGVRIEKSRPRASRALVVVPNRPRDASSGHPDPRWRAAPDPAPSGEPVNRASRRVRARGSGVTALLRA